MDKEIEKLVKKIDNKKKPVRNILYLISLILVLLVLIISFVLIEQKSLIPKFLGFAVFITAVKVLVIIFKQIYQK